MPGKGPGDGKGGPGCSTAARVPDAQGGDCLGAYPTPGSLFEACTRPQNKATEQACGRGQIRLLAPGLVRHQGSVWRPLCIGDRDAGLQGDSDLEDLAPPTTRSFRRRKGPRMLSTMLDATQRAVQHVAAPK